VPPHRLRPIILLPCTNNNSCHMRDLYLPTPNDYPLATWKARVRAFWMHSLVLLLDAYDNAVYNHHYHASHMRDFHLPSSNVSSAAT
jgi:hypothetical protein